ncbi:LamB/YcsF family protein [Terrimonas sp. NA20]|uniref:LamB/YcsF family protein n=1 Tax=Terrimonas ginsenosidimutans TaxID=2908004 RepID=A0ABS9KL98_9BACT|nr:5-oxoprolinase subunit PxpA [Terrimonas ginsenosidimutans]MCG2613102.1 LamB/YcsF family protein [Terrimonas ginsenosidimutans]
MNGLFMPVIDINCDMGEGVGNDAALMPYISSANIACGYHAGDMDTMNTVIELAMAHDVSIGAHVSFPDKENFGRSEMQLPLNEIYVLVQDQLRLMIQLAKGKNASVKHIKPHGALYNMSARQVRLAKVIAQAVADIDPSMVLMGLSGSCSIIEADKLGLKTASEVFADRRYEEDGSLRSRSLPGAMIENEEEALQQVLQMIMRKSITAFSGKQIPVSADTICIHGDGAHAVEFAKRIHHTLKDQSVAIKAF